MYTKGDFHLHTNASDGEMTPSEIIKLAKEKKYDIISITDHDSTSSLNSSLLISEKLGIKIIPGIELSTIYNKETIHILGYFKDERYKNTDFQNFLTELKQYRITRGRKMVENIRNIFNINITYDEVNGLAKGVIQRPHIAKAILNSSSNYSYDYIFDKIIGSSSPAYVPNKHINIWDGIKMLKALGALVVLAHPALIKKTDIHEMMKFDFDGIEAIYPMHTKYDTEKYIKIASAYNKFITAGSDTHELNDKDKAHGIIGDVSLKDKYLDTFVKFINQ